MREFVIRLLQGVVLLLVVSVVAVLTVPSLAAAVVVVLAATALAVVWIVFGGLRRDRGTQGQLGMSAKRE